MARKPTHYRMKVNRPVEASGIVFKPDARYTVKAAIHDRIKEVAADAIASAEPMFME
jgi:hypothetical protein